MVPLASKPIDWMFLYTIVGLYYGVVSTDLFILMRVITGLLSWAEVDGFIVYLSDDSLAFS